MSNLAAQDLLNRVQNIPNAWARLQSLFEAPERLTNSEVLEVGDSLYSIVAQFIYTQSHDQLGSVIVCRDVTAMARAERLKDELILQMSHELRTPLNAIIGLTEMMVTNAARFGTEKAQEPLQRVNRAGTHLLGLINQVLDLSKIEAGKLELNPQTVQLAPLIEEVIGTARQLAEQNKNRIVVEAIHLLISARPNRHSNVKISTYRRWSLFEPEPSIYRFLNPRLRRGVLPFHS
jgi:signal transduction histidine kinase